MQLAQGWSPSPLDRCNRHLLNVASCPDDWEEEVHVGDVLLTRGKNVSYLMFFSMAMRLRLCREENRRSKSWGLGRQAARVVMAHG